jgi:hypothetical protein
MEDIEYMQNKMFAAMRVPKTFLNFQEAQGKGQNLSIMDIRFSRMVNRIQQFLLMELNKIAMIHLYIMGLDDEIGNFSLSLNNPSSQIEAQELNDLNNRLGAMQTALTDPGIGIPMMSLHRALKEIMKMSDSEIKDMLNEIRIEKAMAAELAATSNIIKKTGIFDSVDRIYGDYEAMNNPQQAQAPEEGAEDGGPGGGLGGGLGGDFGGDMDDLGGPGDTGEGDVSGDMGETGMENALSADAGTPLMENKTQLKNNVKTFTQRYFSLLSEDKNINDEQKTFDYKIATINNSINEVCNTIDKLVNTEEMENEQIISGVKENIKDIF